MKLSIKLILVTVFAIILTSCSTVSDFIIVNNSKSDLEVEYQVKGTIEKPLLLSAGNIKDKSKDFLAFPSNALTIDEDLKTIRLKLAPNKALRITRRVNYAGHDSEDSDFTKLKLSGENGTSEFQGKQTQTQFTKQDNGDYVIFYN